MSEEFVQVAGHGAITLNSDGSRLMKPTTTEEALFYEALRTDPILQALGRYTPTFFGAVRNEVSSPLPWRIEMENLTFKLQRLSVMDIKIGAIRHTPTTPFQKVQLIEKKEGPTSSPKLNFSRICGVHHWFHDVVAGCWRQWLADRDVFRNLARGPMAEALLQFCTVSSFCSSSGAPVPSPDPRVVQSYLNDVQSIAMILHDHPQILQRYSFISASLLFFHGFSETDGAVVARVRLIDFAHTAPCTQSFPDEIVKFFDGICVVRDMLQCALKELTQPSK